ARGQQRQGPALPPPPGGHALLGGRSPTFPGCGGGQAAGMDAVLAAAEQFGPFDGRAWVNTAHQGPRPRPAREAARDAAALKAAPHRIRDDDFSEVPERLRGLLARLVGGDAEQVVLGNSPPYGLHLVANGLSLGGGDDVLVVEGDYPATVLPWRRLAGAGVRVRVVRPRRRRGGGGG